MKTKNDWNPELYLKYDEERTRPAIDLASRIKVKNPENIIDIGCGPGNSTHVLSKMWPESRIIGIDNSTSMIKSAKANYPDIEFKIEDATKMKTDEKYGIIFSNATIQWVNNQEKLISNFVDMLEDDGTLAIQVPQYNLMPASDAIKRVSLKKEWKKQTSASDDVFTFHSSSFYYDLLSIKVKSVFMWETSYFHVMPSHQTVVEMLKSTGIRPFLDKLDTEEEKAAFLKDVLKEIIKTYPVQKDENVLFPFKRLFFIGYKS